jgi:PleD family two-component response regulator
MTTHTALRREASEADPLPQRILLVDDDELELELMADRLKSIGFEVATAGDGSQALALLDREWFPLLITDREMPVMSGLELTEQLRARGAEDVYVVMLTVRDAGVDYERGYLAGVDDYLTKKLPDAELLARVRKGFATLAMRRSLRQARAELAQQGSLHPVSGAHTHEHLLSALPSECRRAARYGRHLSVLTIAIETNEAGLLGGDVLRRIFEAVRAAVRADVDWIAHIEGAEGEPVFVVVLPEAATADAVTIKHRLQRTVRALAGTAAWGERVRFTFGFASIDPARTDRRDVEPVELVKVAELCRACLRRRGGLQLAAVQASVAQGLSISCRQGYALETQCHFMSDVRPRSAALQEESFA